MVVIVADRWDDDDSSRRRARDRCIAQVLDSQSECKGDGPSWEGSPLGAVAGA